MFVPSFLAQLLAAAAFPQGQPNGVDPDVVSDFTINSLSTLTQGQKAALPTVELTPGTAKYKSLVFAAAPATIAEVVADGVQIKAAGDFTITATLTRADDSTLVRTKTFTVDALVPLFTAQPASDAMVPGTIYYQKDQPLNISGAAVSGASAYQWQKKQVNGAWADLPRQTAINFSKTVAADSDEGTYRLMAINGNKSTTSDEIPVNNAFLWMQNDSTTQVGAAFSIAQGEDVYHWNMITPSQTGSIRYPSVRVRLVSAPTVDIPAAAVGTVTAVSSDSTIARVNGINNRQVQLVMNNQVGTATVTIKWGQLTSFLTVPVDYAVPTITTQPAATISVAVGAKLEIKPVIGSNVNATATYQWQKLGAGGTTWTAVTGQTALNFSKAAAVAGDAGSYRLVITNGTKSATTNTSVVTVA